MNVRVANAPVSWGVFTAADERNPPWSQVLDEIVAAGYGWIELGPFGYLPTDAETLEAEFGRRSLRVSATFLYEELSLPEARESLLVQARGTCALLRSVGASHLVVIDAMAAPRMATAGRSDDALRLDDGGWERLVANVGAIADVAATFDLTVAFHPHVGTYVEFEDEIARFTGQLNDPRVRLCIDTGHAAYAGLDPVALYRQYADRVAGFHFKDVDATVRAQVVRDRLGWDAAVTADIFCPLGRGCVDFPALCKALETSTFDGWGTVEQDTETGRHSAAAASARASLAYLQSIGLAPEQTL